MSYSQYDPSRIPARHCLQTVEPFTIMLFATQRTARATLAWFALALCSATVGCAGLPKFDLSKPIPWRMGEDEIQRPSRMTAVWTDTVLNQPGQSSRRGFGGRVMFYNNDSDSPIRVDGQLTVFAFDDTDRSSNHCAPDRKYVFTAEQLPKHYSQSKVGHSYSVWLPWDVVGGPQRRISLVARFESVEGEVVLSEMANQILPGITPEPALPATTPAPLSQAATAQPVVQQAAYHAPANLPTAAPIDPQPNRPRMTTTTIPVAPSFGQHTAWNGPYRAPSTHSAEPLQTAAGMAVAPLAISTNEATVSAPPPSSGFQPGRLRSSRQFRGQGAVTN